MTLSTFFVIILLVLPFIILAITIRKKILRKTIHVTQITPEKVQIETPEIQKELDMNDIKYYQDIEKEFNLRKKLYHQATTPEITLVTDDIPILPIPDYILNQLTTNAQNVHDTFVQKNIKDLYNAHRIHTDTASAIQEMHNQCPEVAGIIDQIQKRNSSISNLDANEIDILANVWTHALTNQNIRDNLLLQLKDGVDQTSGEIVCPTGTTSRIVSALAIEHPEEMPRDRSIMNTEVLAKFSKLYSETDDKIKVKSRVLLDY